MFLPNVGSDACLVLDAIYNSESKTATTISDVSMDDLQEAAKTRIVIFRVKGFPIVNLTILGFLLAIDVFTNGVSVLTSIDGTLPAIASAIIDNNKLTINLRT